MNSCGVNKKGFTLIELLVVISIISLLSSIVLASLTEVRERARVTIMVQEANQVRSAIYTSQLEGGNLMSTSRLTGNNSQSGWTNTLSDLDTGDFLTSIPDFSNLELLSSSYPRTRPNSWVDGAGADYYCEGGIHQPQYFVYFYTTADASLEYVGVFPRILRTSNDTPLSRRYCLFLPIE